MYVYRYKCIYLYVCNMYIYIIHIFNRWYICIYTHIFCTIMIYYVILCYIVLGIFNWFHIVIYAPLARLRPMSQSWSQRFRAFFMGGTSPNFIARNPQLQKKKKWFWGWIHSWSISYVHDVPLIFIWSIFEKPFIWPVGHFWTSIKGIPSPGAWGVLRKPGYHHESHWLSWRLGDLVNSSLATGLYRQIWLGEPLFSDVFWSVALFLSPSKGGWNRKNVQQWSMPIYVVTWNNWWVQCTYWLTIAQKSQIPRGTAIQVEPMTWPWPILGRWRCTRTKPAADHADAQISVGSLQFWCLQRAWHVQCRKPMWKTQKNRTVQSSCLYSIASILLLQLSATVHWVAWNLQGLDASHCGITDKLGIYIYIIWHADVCITMSILYLLYIYIYIYISLSRHIYIFTYVVYACSILLQWSPTCRSIIGCTWIIADLHWWCGFICSPSRLQSCSSCISALFFWYVGRKAALILLFLQH